MRKYIDATEYHALQEELKERQDGKHCVICGKELPKYRRKYCSEECRGVVLSSLKSWPIIRHEAIKRDKYTCQDCGYKAPVSGWWQSTDGLEVHHIVPISQGGEEFDLNNVVTLCHDCHMKRHQGLRRELQKARLEREFEARRQKRLDRWLGVMLH